MFRFFKKRPQPAADELSRLTKSACDDVKEKWIYFDRTIHLKAEVSLAQKIDLFAQPLAQFFRAEYPQLLLGGSEIFWLTTFTAVLESGTHSKELVNAASAELRSKYEGKALGSNSNTSTVRAPIDSILPSFAPVLFERGIPGYSAGPLAPGEHRIDPEGLRSLLIASAFIGALNHAVQLKFDYDRVAEALTKSVHAIPGLSAMETQVALDLVDRFHSFRIIREEHSLDDWLCEALWPAFQTVPYSYPSAMSGVVSYGLTINDTLQKVAVEY